MSIIALASIPDSFRNNELFKNNEFLAFKFVLINMAGE